MVDVFVSHAGHDRPWAEWAAWHLVAAGLTVELDCWDWAPGDDLAARMSRALDTSRCMVALCSAAYYERDRWTSEEWAAAVVRSKSRPGYLRPVRIDDAEPPALLASLIAVSLVGLSEDRARSELLRAVSPARRPEVAPAHPGSAGVGRPPEDGPRLPGARPPTWNVRHRNPAFTGRDATIVGVRERLTRAEGSRPVVLHGAPGVGKSQIAAEYAARFAGEYDAVWWVEGEQLDLVREQLAAFAVEWGVADPEAPVETAVTALARRCRTRGRWLLVLDNVEPSDDVGTVLLPGPGHVLVTSRSGRWTETAHLVDVAVFTREESIRLIGKHAPQVPAPEADALASAMGDLALGIAQAAAMVAESGMPVGDYLTALEESAATLLQHGRPHSYPVSLAAMTRLVIERLARTDRAAVALLQVCARLEPEPIPLRWFTAAPAGGLDEPLASAVADPVTFRRCIAALRHCGIATVADDRLQLHRLTHLVLRELGPAHETARSAAMASAVLASAGSSRPADEPVTWSELAEFMRQVPSPSAGDDGRRGWRERARDAVAYLRPGDPDRADVGHSLGSSYVVELIAQGLHERYLEDQRRLGATPGSNPSAVEWAELPEPLRQAVRGQVRHIGTVLRSIGATLTPQEGSPFAFRPGEVDSIASMEHRRWVQERLEQGWRPGSTDVARRTTPELVAWDELSERARDRDRAFVRSLPELVAAAGLSIERRA